MKHLTKTFLLPAALVASLFSSPSAQAGPLGPEAAMLPPYCAPRMADDYSSASAKEWIDRFTMENYVHMHHYCIGLMELNRAYGKGRSRGAGDVASSIQNIDYVIKGTAPDFILQPEFHLNKGKALAFMGRSELAALEYQQAIQLKPDYAAPYAALSDFYRDKGAKQKARETVEQGLEKIPDSKALKRRQVELSKGK